MNDWHVDEELLARYAARELDPATGWSVESHVTECASCRATITTAGLVPDARMDRIARAVETRLDAPVPTPVERLLRAVGVPVHVGRLLVATASLTLSWLAAVAFVLAGAVLTARLGWRPQDPADTSALLFLTVAPLVPLAGIAAAFGPNVDPTYEVGLAAPMRSGRLLLIRAVAVLASSLVLAGVAAPFLPGLDWKVAAWIVPALALTATSLALSTRIGPLVATGGVAACWLMVVVGVEAGSHARYAAFGTRGQVVAATVLVCAVIATWVSRDRFEREVGA